MKMNENPVKFLKMRPGKWAVCGGRRKKFAFSGGNWGKMLRNGRFKAQRSGSEIPPKYIKIALKLPKMAQKSTRIAKNDTKIH